MRNIGENEITNMGGAFNYINCECISEISGATNVTLTLDSNTGKYYLEGESVQNGTPTPDNPIEIANTYKAGHYQTTIGGTTYKFNLGDDLRSIGSVKDKFELDITNRTGSITKNIGNVDLGTMNWSRLSRGIDWFFQKDLVDVKPTANNNTIAEALSTHYIITKANFVMGYSQPTVNNSLGITYNKIVVIKNDEYTDINIFKTAMIGAYLNYILETPTTESVEVD